MRRSMYQPPAVRSNTDRSPSMSPQRPTVQLPPAAFTVRSSSPVPSIRRSGTSTPVSEGLKQRIAPWLLAEGVTGALNAIQTNNWSPRGSSPTGTRRTQREGSFSSDASQGQVSPKRVVQTFNDSLHLHDEPLDITFGTSEDVEVVKPEPKAVVPAEESPVADSDITLPVSPKEEEKQERPQKTKALSFSEEVPLVLPSLEEVPLASAAIEIPLSSPNPWEVSGMDVSDTNIVILSPHIPLDVAETRSIQESIQGDQTPVSSSSTVASEDTPNKGSEEVVAIPEANTILEGLKRQHQTELEQLASGLNDHLQTIVRIQNQVASSKSVTVDGMKGALGTLNEVEAMMTLLAALNCNPHAEITAA